MEKQEIKPLKKIMNFSGKTAVVTGGAMGIGREISTRLAEAGANVIITDIDEVKGKKTVAELKDRGFKVRYVKADAAKRTDAEKVINKAVEEFGGLDILINNAGIYPFSPAMETTETLWDKVMDVNVKGVFYHAQAAAKRMKEQKREGVIVNLASIDAYRPGGQIVHYDTSKGSVKMMTRALALELAPHHIRVNAIAPGVIATEGTSGAQAQLEAMKPRIPMKRFGDPDDIARVALFLASDLAGYMTGETVISDGGFLLT